MKTQNDLKCDRGYGCNEPVTHIGERGFLYCSKHSGYSRGQERKRQLRKWEISRLEAGETLPSFKPVSRAKATTVQPKSQEDHEQDRILADLYQSLRARA